MESLRHSQEFSRWIAVWALTAIGPESENSLRIESALEESYESVTKHLDAIYQLILDLLGYRLRYGLTVRQFTIAAEALTEGLLLRERMNAEHFDGIVRPSGPGRASQEWSLLGLAVDALSEAFFELDPDWEPSTTDGAVEPSALTDHVPEERPGRSPRFDFRQWFVGSRSRERERGWATALYVSQPAQPSRTGSGKLPMRIPSSRPRTGCGTRSTPAYHLQLRVALSLATRSCTRYGCPSAGAGYPGDRRRQSFFFSRQPVRASPFGDVV